MEAFDEEYSSSNDESDDDSVGRQGTMEEFEAYAYEEYTSSDEEYADGDDRYRYCRHLNQEIESNDPDCAGVRVDGEHWFAGAGRLIGDSTVLQQLRISIKGREDVTWLSELFQAPSHN